MVQLTKKSQQIYSKIPLYNQIQHLDYTDQLVRCECFDGKSHIHFKNGEHHISYSFTLCDIVTKNIEAFENKN